MWSASTANERTSAAQHCSPLLMCGGGGIEGSRVNSYHCWRVLYYTYSLHSLSRARSLAPSISACCRHRCVLVRYFFFIYFFIQSRRQLRRKATMRNSVFFNSSQMQGWRSQAGGPQHSLLSAVNETHSRSIYRYIYANWRRADLSWLRTAAGFF